MAGRTPRQDGREQPEDRTGEAFDSPRVGGTPGDAAGGATRGVTRDASPDTPWDDLVLDEEFVRGAGTSEPSARARMLAARWSRERPEPQPWRSDEPPAGWFFSRSRRWRRG
ncbi:hypothetical protein HZS56_07885 [Streptomyces sp. A108]|uniref:SGM_3592 family protein n=1 Tax=Streptomyces mayonensis TaxID=2750816 RepID=UPI001C1E8A58|nr:hypothetical protein [Streptomyces sp. A108]MBU6531029.1 hypothetical protein [Streptomyces sp. A108]